MNSKSNQTTPATSPDEDGGTVHPETRDKVKPSGVVDDKSSKVAPTAQPDGRTAHDKDGNAENAGRGHGGRHG